MLKSPLECSKDKLPVHATLTTKTKIIVFIESR